MTPDEQQRLAAVETRVEGLEKHLDDMDEKLDKLVAWANRWKGGFAVLLGVGALIGWFGDKIFTFAMGKH